MRCLLRIVLLAALGAGIYLAEVAITAGPTGRRVQAEFTDAHGLIVGNDVRIDGAPAGRVDAITLTDRGTALVTMRLNDGLPAPRADASAAVRPVDLLGDTYVALELGQAAGPLTAPIQATRTLNDPRLDDLLRVFREPQRAGMMAMLVVLGVALYNRGADLNRAALALRPALAAASGVMQELGSQNANLRQFLVDADQVVAQGAAHRDQLGTLVNSLGALLRNTTAHAAGLDAGLQTMPATLLQARHTAGDLAATAQAARPLADELGSSAGNLSTAAARLGPFLTDLASAVRALHPTLRSATSVLVGGDPTLHALAVGLTSIATSGPDVGRLTTAFVPAAPGIAQGFFVNFPDQASEPGTQPFDPFANSLRDYWRGAAVFSCQAFGLPIEPGCMNRFLAAQGVSLARVAGERHGAPEHRAQQAPDTMTQLLHFLLKP